MGHQHMYENKTTNKKSTEEMIRNSQNVISMWLQQQENQLRGDGSERKKQLIEWRTFANMMKIQCNNGWTKPHDAEELSQLNLVFTKPHKVDWVYIIWAQWE